MQGMKHPRQIMHDHVGKDCYDQRHPEGDHEMIGVRFDVGYSPT